MFISEGLMLPYYAVIFPSLVRSDAAGDDDFGAEILRLVEIEEGYLGMETTADAEGRSITVCYWRTIADIKRWKQQAMHRIAQERGKTEWFSEYAVRIAHVTESYEWKSE